MLVAQINAVQIKNFKKKGDDRKVSMTLQATTAILMVNLPG